MVLADFKALPSLVVMSMGFARTNARSRNSSKSIALKEPTMLLTAGSVPTP